MFDICLKNTFSLNWLQSEYNSIYTANIRGVTLKGISRWPSDHTKNCSMIQYKDDIKGKFWGFITDKNKNISEFVPFVNCYINEDFFDNKRNFFIAAFIIMLLLIYFLTLILQKRKEDDISCVMTKKPTFLDFMVKCSMDPLNPKIYD